MNLVAKLPFKAFQVAAGSISRRSRGSSAPDHRQLVLRVLDPLFELPAIGIGLAAVEAFELGLRGFELLAASASSISFAFTASSTSASARSCSTLKNPGPSQTHEPRVAVTWTRV